MGRTHSLTDGFAKEGFSNMHRTSLSILVILALVAAAPAVADGIDYEPREIHSLVDKNKDGHVDRGEFHVRMVEVFYHADKDKDGLLVLVELQSIDEDIVYLPADDDGDGKITLIEYVDHRFDGFNAADKNGDGQLTVTEVVEAYEGP